MYLSAVESNVVRMQHRVDLLMQLFPWVQMVVFSELAPHGPLLRFAEPLPGPTEDAFRETAAQHRIWLVPGSMYERADDVVYNTASVIDPDGEVVGRYRKMFPFTPYEAGVEAGDEFLVFDVAGAGRFGVTICYDTWFPETVRTMTSMGAEVILHPSLTPTIDRDIELSLVRALAATNQCFFFNINGLGDGGNGRSIVCGPEGLVLHQSGSDEEFIPLEIDLERVRRSREHGILRLGQMLKSFRDRSVDFDIYRQGDISAYLETLGPLRKPGRGSKEAPLTESVLDEL
jgi:predicted amidohydrolase